MNDLLQWQIALKIAQERLTKWKKKKEPTLMDTIGIANLEKFIELMKARIEKEILDEPGRYSIPHLEK